MCRTAKTREGWASTMSSWVQTTIIGDAPMTITSTTISTPPPHCWLACKNLRLLMSKTAKQEVKIDRTKWAQATLVITNSSSLMCSSTVMLHYSVKTATITTLTRATDSISIRERLKILVSCAMQQKSSSMKGIPGSTTQEKWSRQKNYTKQPLISLYRTSVLKWRLG